MNATSPAVASRAARVGRMLGRVALVVGVLCAVAALLAGPAYRTEMLPLGASLQTMRWARPWRSVAPWRRWWRCCCRSRRRALCAGVASRRWPCWSMRWWRRRCCSCTGKPSTCPRSTTSARTPSIRQAFVAVLPLRESARNAVAYPPSTAAEQRKGYPDIGPLTLPMAPQMAFERALQVARAMGWEVVAAAPEALRIEATDTTLLFGFKDDVVVRITPQGPGQRRRRALAVACGRQRLRHQCQAGSGVPGAFGGRLGKRFC